MSLSQRLYLEFASLHSIPRHGNQLGQKESRITNVEVHESDRGLRIVQNDESPPKARLEALRKVPRPPLILLRRLLVKSATRIIPVRASLYDLAALLCRFSLLMAVALLMIKDFHAWEPLGFCFIADTLAVIESPREPHFPNRNQRYVLDFARLPF
jgi:hypothetical protein